MKKLLMNYSFTIIYQTLKHFMNSSWNVQICRVQIRFTYLKNSPLEILFLEIFIKSIEISLQCSMFKSTRDTLKPITTHAHTAAIRCKFQEDEIVEDERVQNKADDSNSGKSNISTDRRRRVHLTEIAVYFRDLPRIWSMDIEINCIRSRLNFISNRIFRNFHICLGNFVQLAQQSMRKEKKTHLCYFC